MMLLLANFAVVLIMFLKRALVTASGDSKPPSIVVFVTAAVSPMARPFDRSVSLKSSVYFEFLFLFFVSYITPSGLAMVVWAISSKAIRPIRVSFAVSFSGPSLLVPAGARSLEDFSSSSMIRSSVSCFSLMDAYSPDFSVILSGLQL